MINIKFHLHFIGVKVNKNAFMPVCSVKAHLLSDKNTATVILPIEEMTATQTLSLIKIFVVRNNTIKKKS